MSDDERRRRFLLNWYAEHGAAGLDSSNDIPQDIAIVGMAIVGLSIAG